MWAFQKFKAKVRYLPCFNQMYATRALKNIRNIWHRQLARLRESGTEEQKIRANTLRTNIRKRRPRKRPKGKGQEDDAKAQAKARAKEKRPRIKRKVSILMNIVYLHYGE